MRRYLGASLKQLPGLANWKLPKKNPCFMRMKQGFYFSGKALIFLAFFCIIIMLLLAFMGN
jgi:hypothetical protein